MKKDTLCTTLGEQVNLFEWTQATQIYINNYNGPWEGT